MAYQPDLELDRIAQVGLEAGIVADPLPERNTRALITSRKYGEHTGNYLTAPSEGLLAQSRITRPSCMLFMSNWTRSGIEMVVRMLAEMGIDILVVLRTYYPPEPPTAGHVGGYISKCLEEIGQCLEEDGAGRPIYPFLFRAYQEGRLASAPLNETNIGSEGFARGRNGFASALSVWKQVRSAIKAQYPKTKVCSIGNTPGNDDAYFLGDALNQPYWFHGAEAARENPDPVQIARAVTSCPMREMFELCDIITTHVYANTNNRTMGTEQKWYSRRHEQYIKFLPYNKPIIIKECDMGMDESPQDRATCARYFLEQIVEPNDRITYVCWWWNASFNEADQTWTKNFTRDSGNMYPIVYAIRDYNEGSTGGGGGGGGTGGGTTPPPTGSINLPSWVGVVRASVPVGQRYWKLVDAYWQDFNTSGGTHHIYVKEPHSPAQTFAVNNGQQIWHVALDKPANEPAGNFGMWAGNIYSLTMDDFPSDKVTGMTMPQNQHVNYFLTYALVTKEAEVPTEPTSLKDKMWAACEAVQIPINRTFALPKRLLLISGMEGDNFKGYDIVSPEIGVSYAGVNYRAQMAQRPSDDHKILAYCKVGDTDNVTVLYKPERTSNLNVTDQLAEALSIEFGAKFQDLRGKLPQSTKKNADGSLVRYSRIDSRGFDYIAVHHSAGAKNDTWERIALMHINDNGWAGIGYHMGIGNGKVALFDSLDTERAHVYGMNHEAIGVCILGNYETQTVNATDLDLAKRLVKVLDSVYNPRKIIKGHGDLRVGGGTECPGKNLKPLLPSFRA